MIPAAIFLLLNIGEPLGAQDDLYLAQLGKFHLESGEVIEDCRIAYRTLGQLNTERSNAILMPTWFTGTSENLIRLIRRTGLLDTLKYFVIAVDALGNGVSSSPSNSKTQPGASFPRFTIRDLVRSQHRLLTEELSVSSVEAVVGFSMGGMQAFEWAVSYPGFAGRIVPIVGSPRLAAYDIVLWETELQLLELLEECRCQSPATVLNALWFLIGRTPDYHARRTPRENVQEVLDRLDDRAYTQGQAHDRASQLRAMIHHNVAGPFNDELDQAAAQVQADMLVVVGLTDHVVTPEPALEFARLAGAETLELPNDCGHTAASCAQQEVNSAIARFLAKP